MRRCLALLVCVALGVAACSGSDDVESRPIVDVFAPYRGAEADALADALVRFEQDSGIVVRYVGSADFVRDLRNRLIGDEQPDIAIVPQPGLVTLLDDLQLLVPHGPATTELLDGGAEFWDLGLADSEIALPFRVAIKSLVWFRPDVFATNGWQTPRTLNELERLVNDIQSAGDMAPWCFSISSGAATGWPATDWVEDAVLRLHGPDVYDDWRDGEIEFSDERIAEAFDLVDRLVRTQGRVAGGQRSLLQTDVIETALPLFGPEPGCAMYKQASFAQDWFPGSPTVGPDGDVDFFVVPGIGIGEPAPLVIGGDHIVAFDDRAEVDRTIAFLLDDADLDLTGSGGYLTGRLDRRGDDSDTSLTARLIDVDIDERVVRFDASDSMEPSFGSDVLWRGMTDWMSATETLPVVLSELDAARAELASPAE